MNDRTERAVLLTDGLKIPTLVWWKTLSGEVVMGTLVNWDNGTAIVLRQDTGTEVAVRIR